MMGIYVAIRKTGELCQTDYLQYRKTKVNTISKSDYDVDYMQTTLRQRRLNADYLQIGMQWTVIRVA